MMYGMSNNIKIEKCNESFISYIDDYSLSVREYYLYCVNLFKEILLNNNYNINIIFGDFFVEFNNDFKTIKIDIQYEHTIVKPGGRDVNNAPIGNIKLDQNTNYLVRIDNLNHLNKMDLIIEYSIPNIINIQKSNKFQEYEKKITHIYPTIYDKIDSVQQDKNLDVITTFQNIYEPRRFKLLHDCLTSGLDVKNINNCYDGNEIKKIYEKTKILINVRQTDYHDTLEELRILPALLNKCVIISEYAPLIEHIPYSKFIIWSNYSNIIKTIKEVKENYEQIYDSIFNSVEYYEMIGNLKQNNKNNIKNTLSKI